MGSIFVARHRSAGILPAAAETTALLVSQRDHGIDLGGPARG
jgi:hypothetical protein